MKPKLKLARSEDDVSQEDIFRAGIEQNWFEWTGPSGKPWVPFAEPQENPALPVEEISRRATKQIIIDQPVPLWRRLMRWLRGIW